MDGSHDPQPKLTGRLHGFALAALQYAKARVELLQHELAEEKSRLGALAARGLLFAFALLTTVQLVFVFVVAAFWDTAYRLHAIVALLLLTAAVSTAAWRAVRRCLEESAQPLAATLAEFDKDREALQRLGGGGPPASPPSSADPAACEAPASLDQPKPAAGNARPLTPPASASTGANPYASKSAVGA